MESSNRFVKSDPDDIYITGISGSFPNSTSVKNLGDNLFNKVDLVSDDERRWKNTYPEIPQRTGKIYDIEKFDATFFDINYKQAHAMDPMSRILLEKVYEAIIDAGYNPCDFRGTKTGVINGMSVAESEKDWCYEKMEVNDYGIACCSRSMSANRVSHWLGVTGPSFAIDTACSSSMFALEQAYSLMKNEICDTVIVCGSNLVLHPLGSLQFARLGVLSPDGICKSFDERANGYVRSEAVVACLLQREKNSRRVYAQLVHAKTNCDGYKEYGITYPAGNIQQELLEEFYDECGVDPTTLEYVEAHGTGTKVGDPEELKAITNIFCKERKGSLLIGSVKSNLGHSEPSSGLCSIAKLCVAYQTGYLPPNINFAIPRKEVPGLHDGTLQVVTEKTPWNRGLSGISSFGFGGANGHVLLRNVARDKINNGLPYDDLPRLVCVSGRTQSAVDKILDDLESRTMDVDQIGLLHKIHEQDIPRHSYRGYVLLRSLPNKSMRLARDVQTVAVKEKPVWFVYSGLGTNWPAYARQFMAIPAFASSIQKCHNVLKPKGFKLIDFISEQSANLSYERCSLIGIVAVHIALTDLLATIGLKPDHIIGYDIAELSSAYADGCLTLEQTILAAYNIALASETIFNKTTMLTVKLSYNKLAEICPKEIDISYHICFDFCIITGPTEAIKNFMIKLTAQGISVSQHSSSVTSFHSRYAAEIAPLVIKYLKEIIPTPKPRSGRWVSTSVPQSQWKNDDMSSADYHTNSLINPVLFDESSSLIQPNSVIIEMGAQEILPLCINPSLEKAAIKVSLAKQKDGLLVFFNTLGNLYEAGLNMQLANLYPPIQFPVAQGTPMLAHLVEWEHSEDWYVICYKSSTKLHTWENTVKINLQNEEEEYLTGHKIDGRTIYPATGYLVLVWDMFAAMTAREYTEVSVVFEDVYFMRATNFPKDGVIEFVIVIHEGSGKFEITESNVPVVSGRVYEKNNLSQTFWEVPELEDKEEDSSSVTMYRKDFYKELNLRGYQYGGLFRGVVACNVKGTSGRLSWENNWVSFLDTLMQVNIVAHDTRSLYVPTRVEKLSIDVKLHDKIISKKDVNIATKSLNFQTFPDAQITRSGGAELRNIHVTAIAKKPSLGIPVYEKNEFVPNNSDSIIPFTDSIRSSLQLILENVQTYKFKTIELVDEEYETNNIYAAIETIAETLADLPLVQADLQVLSDEPLIVPPNVTINNKKFAGQTNTILFVGANLLKRQNVLQEGAATLKKSGFVLSRETSRPDQYSGSYDLVTVHQTEYEYLVLLRQKPESKPVSYIQIVTSDQSYPWLETVKAEMLKSHSKIVLYNQNEDVNGLLGLVNCLRKEPSGEMVYGLLIADPEAPPFDPNLQLYKEQLDKGLALNVFKNGKWGTYRHLLLKNMDLVPVTHAYVNTATIGDLTCLAWWEGPIQENHTFKNPARSLIHVYCSAMNFRDVMVALGRVTLDAVARGRLAQDCVQGIEITGRSANGCRVMAICEKGISNLVEVDQTLVWPFPDEWTFEEAATVPVAYGTVYLSLVMVGKIRRGESILIHAGSGGVGQAAINIALHRGLEVFTTVGTPAKRAFIKKLFPQLKDSNIGNSRDTSFEEMIRRETNGRGVDVVLNSLADDKLQTSVKCLCRRGRFLEIGKYDITINTQLEMCFMKKEISFHGVMLDYIFEKNSEKLRNDLKELVLAGIASGEVRPLTYCAFAEKEVEAAYRYMAAGKHIGKVIIKIRDEPDANIFKPSHNRIPAIPRYICNKDDVYVIIGGLGGFGLELIDWLVLRGARKIVVSSRRGISSGYQAFRLRIWANYGTEVQISTEDVTTEVGCEKLLKMAAKIGPVIAIFNLAVILNDAVFTNQTPETFRNSYGPKAATTLHLDKLSRKLCTKLRDFVVFSSVSCGRGNAGQTNYGLSNSVMERVCEKRKEQGLPALAIQWGAIGDVGLVADMQEENIQLEIGGTLQQRIASCLQAMDQFLKQDAPIISSIVVAEKRTSNLGSLSVVDAVAAIMGIADLKTVSQLVPLSELGMDSIMAVEIKQTLEREFEIFISAQDIRSITFNRLSELQQAAANGSTDEPAKNTVDDDSYLLKLLLRNFGDEKMVSVPFINYPDKNGRQISDEILFMLPGIEGCAAALDPLCKKLDIATCVMQLGLEDTSLDLERMVQSLYKTVKPRLTPGGPFYLLGYSFGSLPIIKLAGKLEREGHKGTVICLDGSPAFVHSLILKSVTDDDADGYILQNSIMFSVIDHFMPNTTVKAKLASKMNPKQPFEERIKYGIEVFPDIKYSPQFLILMILAIYNRIKETIYFEKHNTEKIKSPIILIRQKHLPSYLKCDELYDLSKLTEDTVTVHCVEADHVSVLENDDSAKIINNLMKNLIQNHELVLKNEIVN